MSKPAVAINERWKASITTRRRDISHPVHGWPSARLIPGSRSIYAYDARDDPSYAKECHLAAAHIRGAGHEERMREANRKAGAFERWWREQHAQSEAAD